MKEEIYRIVTIRESYGAKCRPIKKLHMNKINIIEKRMLQWIRGKFRKDSIGYNKRDLVEMIWIYSTHANNGAAEDKFFYAD